jgi:GNAT superfamily N-acetyltransferase
MPSPEIRLADRTDRDTVVSTVVAAFDQDPAFRWFFPTDASWDRNVRPFVGALFDSRVDANATWLADDGAALALWADPNADSLRADLGALDEDAVARLAAYNAATTDGLPDSPFWYLGILATRPDRQGERLARTVMEVGLRRAAETGLPAYLETTKPSNVQMYERSGWAVTAENSIDTITIWVLRHEGVS